MEIQKISCNYNYNYNTNPVSVKKSYYSKLNNQIDTFTPSFGLKPLEIPAGMFKTVEEANHFSKIVEQVRTGKISKETAKKLVGKGCDENLFAQVIDFIQNNDPKISTYDEELINKWFNHKFNTAKKALNGEKASKFAEEYENLAYFERTDNFDKFSLSELDDELF